MLTEYAPNHGLEGITTYPLICVEVTLVREVEFRMEPVAFRKTTVVCPGMKFVPAIVKLTVVFQ
jgi:hypothetical protein